MRKPLVAGNWKMNGTQQTNQVLLEALVSGVSKAANGTGEVAVFPPAVYLSQVANTLEGSGISWGLQNIFFENGGAYTGENSPVAAKDMQCVYTLVGHSERRSLFGETDEQIVKKVAALISVGIVPVLCVGETLEQRESGNTLPVIEQQVRTVLDTLTNVATLNIVIAYEPVWAIGTGRTATPEQAQEVHSFIRRLLKSYSDDLSEKTRLLYGGSVNDKNARDIFSQNDIDGGLVGGASLKPAEFITICEAVG